MKTRIRQTMIIEGSQMQVRWIVEVVVKGRWLPFGSAGGFAHFDSKAQAELTVARLKLAAAEEAVAKERSAA